MPSTVAATPKAYLAELLASQKQYCSLYLIGVYRDPALEAELKAAFKREGEAIDRLIAAVPPETLIEQSKTIHR